jgi:hypothetical protein
MGFVVSDRYANMHKSVIRKENISMIYTKNPFHLKVGLLLPGN